MLVVTQSYPPIKGPRAIKSEAIVNELLDLNYDVTLITRGELGGFDPEFTSNLDQLILMSTKVWPTFSFNLGKSVKLGIHKILRIFNGLLYKLFGYPGVQSFWSVLWALKKLETKSFRNAISIDGPQSMHWAIAVARKFGLIKLDTWIADCGDPLARTNRAGNKVAPYFKIIEDFFCARADFITVPVSEGLHYFNNRFIDKIRVVEHSLTFPELDQLPNKNTSGINQILHLAYAGNMLPYQQQAKEFFKALSKSDADFQFHIYGENYALIEAICQNNDDLKNKVVLHGSIDRRELLQKLTSHDFLVYFPYPGTGQIPFKLIDYAFTGLPILEFSTIKKDEDKLYSFLSGNYGQQIRGIDYKRYSSKHTVQKYIALFNAE